MPFIQTDCTSKILKKLAASSNLEKNIGQQPVGKPCYVDISRKAALFPHRFDRTSFPDETFTLIINSQLFEVFERRSSYDNKIKVTVHEETQDIQDTILESLIREVFSVVKGVNQSSLPIIEINRSMIPKPPRKPKNIISDLNSFIKIMPTGSEYLVENLFVPTLVRPNEIESFVKYGRSTAWKGLNHKAKELFIK